MADMGYNSTQQHAIFELKLDGIYTKLKPLGF